MLAAEATGRAAQPLPLFYSLSQAGKAIVACRPGVAATSHGLRLGEPATPDVLCTAVEIHKTGWFSAVSACMGSVIPSEPPRLGALIASLPGLGAHLPPGASWPRAVRVHVDENPWPSYGRQPVRVLFEPAPQDLDQLELSIPHYPSADGRLSRVATTHWSSEMIASFLGDPGGVGLHFDLTDPPGSEPAAGNVLSIERFLSQDGEDYWLRPHVVPVRGESAPSLLMTWWLLLFCLSMLARYFPQDWVAALDLDRSAVAVLLDECMDRAMDAVPALVLDALENDAGGLAAG